MRLRQATLASLLLLTTLGAAANAEEAPRFVCTSGDSERVIEVVYRNTEQNLPCEVRYHKDGTEETLWHAQNEVGFCESQAEEFAANQQQWGWECEAAHDADTATDDTHEH